MDYQNMGTPVNSTKISMHERFSSLLQKPQIVFDGPRRSSMLQPASSRNRKLMQDLELRHSMKQEALLHQFDARSLPLGRSRQRSRIGRTTSILGRLGYQENISIAARLGTVPGRGRMRGRGRGYGLQRNSTLPLLPSSSLQPLLPIGRQSRSRSRSRSRMRMDRSLSRNLPKMRMDRSLSRGLELDIDTPRSRSRSRGRQNGPQIRGRSRSRTRGGAGPRTRSRGRVQTESTGGRVNSRGRIVGVRGRGRGRGRGRSNSRIRNAEPQVLGNVRGRGRANFRGRRGRSSSRKPLPNKDDLDKQLDQYMASSRDQEDTYMKTDISSP